MTAAKLGAALIATTLLALTVACGGDDDTTSSTPTQTPSSTIAASLTTTADLPIPNPTEIYVAATDGSQTKLLYATDLYASYAWSPDGKTMAISEVASGNATTVRFLDLNGHELARATHDGYLGFGLVWSPDGKYVVGSFSGLYAGPVPLVAIAAEDGAQKVLLTLESSSYVYPSGWLASGELMVVRTEQGGAGKLVAIDVEAGASRDVSDTIVLAGFFGRPALSPDGTTIAAFSPADGTDCDGGPGLAVWTIDLASGAGTRRQQGNECGSGAIVWSPDGTQLAFSDLRVSKENSGVFVLDLATQQSRRVSTGLHNANTWLEDGTILANEYPCTGCDAGGPYKLLAINSAAANVRQISAGTTDVFDDGRIVAVDGAALKTLDAAGNQTGSIAMLDGNGWQYNQLAWAPDGTHVGYARIRGQGAHYFEVNTDGSGFQWLGSHDGTTKLSRDGKRLAYLVYTGTAIGKSFATLWLADRGGSNAAQVAVEGSVGDIAWSPDSLRLVFSVILTPGTNGFAYVVNADGSDVHAIEAQGLLIEAKTGPASWSPDGKLVTFRDGASVLNVDSGEVKTLTTTVTGKRIAQWGADSRHLLFADGTTNSVQIVVIEDGSVSEIAPSGNRNIAAVAQSPDGSRIAFFSTSPAGKTTQVHVMNSDGSDDRLVFEGDSVSGAPVWSPDGSSFAVNAADGDAYGLFVVSADGSQHKQLSRGSSIDTITWRDNDTLQFSTFVGGL